ncbi:hypothetical protein ACLOJK_020013 [Asimina triloba]
MPMKLDVEASFRRLSDQAVHAREVTLRLSSKLGTMKAKAATLRDQVVSLGVKKAELSSKLESSQVKIMQL